MDCICTYGYDIETETYGIHYCPLHAAATETAKRLVVVEAANQILRQQVEDLIHIKGVKN